MGPEITNLQLAADVAEAQGKERRVSISLGLTGTRTNLASDVYSAQQDREVALVDFQEFRSRFPLPSNR